VLWFLLLLGVTVVIGVFVWDYRRKAARREAASKQRFDRMFKTPPPAADAPAPVAADVPAAAPVPKLAVFPPRGRFLGQPETLVYLLLKTAMPDHVVFAGVTLASVLDVPGTGFDREQQLRRLSTCPLDFVVCDRDMRIVAVVEIERPGAADPSGMDRYKLDCLEAAAVRRVALNPKALPPREALRALIGGGGR